MKYPIKRLHVGEARLINMDLSSKTGTNDLTGTPTVVSDSTGVTVGTPVVSGKKIQCLYTAVAEGEWLVRGTATDDGSTAQTVKGHAMIKVVPD